jgi:hypothetical protein
MNQVMARISIDLEVMYMLENKSQSNQIEVDGVHYRGRQSQMGDLMVSG